MSTRTYYQGPDAVVTDELFIWRGTPTKGFVVNDLRNVGRGRADVDPLRPHKRYAVVGAAVLIGATWNTMDAPGVYILAAVALAIPAVLALASRRLRPARWELRATYHSREVILYSTADERVFNQVTRALRRSMEDARSPARDIGLAAA
jgi:hypothetical protein